MKYTCCTCAKYFSTIHVKPNCDVSFARYPCSFLDQYKNSHLKNTEMLVFCCDVILCIPMPVGTRWNRPHKNQAIFHSLWNDESKICQNILLSARTNHRSRKSSCPESRVNRDSTNYTFQTRILYFWQWIEIEAK